MRRWEKRLSAFDAANVVFLALLGVLVAYPFIYTVSISVSDAAVVARGGVSFFPRGININAYKQVLSSHRIWLAYRNTVIYAALGVVIRVFLLVLTAYPLSRVRFPGRNFFMFLIGFTMLFNGGMVPTFLVVRGVGLLDTIWAMIIPGALGAYNVIIVRTFFQSTIHPSLEESAALDGANDLQVLFRIVVPLSTPIIAVMSLFIVVGIWNNYLQALLYLIDENLYPLTIILRDIVVQAEGEEFMGLQELYRVPVPTQSVQSATLIVSILPVLAAYPFIQKYFVKGIMIGAIKG